MGGSSDWVAHAVDTEDWHRGESILSRRNLMGEKVDMAIKFDEVK
jgi:hypothetical protein